MQFFSRLYFVIVFAFVFLLSNLGFSQDKKGKESKPKLSKEEKKRAKLKNIDFIDKNFYIRPAYSIQYNQLSITDKNKRGTPINYRPNILGSAGGAVKIKGIVASYMLRIPPSESSISKFGKTDYQNIDIDIQSRLMGVDFDYIDYKGFYLANAKDFSPSFDSKTTPHPQQPDLRYFSVGLKLTFLFTRSFSINSAFAQTERMKKSAGSFMMTIGDRYSQIQSDTSFIPYSEYEYHKKFFEPKFNGIYFNSTYMAFGFGYSFVKKNFSFTPILLAGAGVQEQIYYDDRWGMRRDNVHLRFPLYFSYKNAVGWNYNNFFVRLIWAAELDKTQIKPKGNGFNPYTGEFFKYRKGFDNTSINMFYLNGQVSFGVRF